MTSDKYEPVPCPECGNANSTHAYMCPQCGRPLKEADSAIWRILQMFNILGICLCIFAAIASGGGDAVIISLFWALLALSASLAVLCAIRKPLKILSSPKQ